MNRHRMVGVLNKNSKGMTDMCTACQGYENADLPLTCPNRPLTRFESTYVQARKLEHIDGQWSWNPTIDWELHGEPPSVEVN